MAGAQLNNVSRTLLLRFIGNKNVAFERSRTLGAQISRDPWSVFNVDFSPVLGPLVGAFAKNDGFFPTLIAGEYIGI